jgi:hypothetical protein
LRVARTSRLHDRSSFIAGFQSQPRRRSWRIRAPWVHGSTGPSSWVWLPLSQSLGLSALSLRSLYPSSLSLNIWLSLPLSHCVRARRKKEEERRRRTKKKKEAGRRPRKEREKKKIIKEETNLPCKLLLSLFFFLFFFYLLNKLTKLT